MFFKVFSPKVLFEGEKTAVSVLSPTLLTKLSEDCFHISMHILHLE